ERPLESDEQRADDHEGAEKAPHSARLPLIAGLLGQRASERGAKQEVEGGREAQDAEAPENGREHELAGVGLIVQQLIGTVAGAWNPHLAGANGCQEENRSEDRDEPRRPHPALLEPEDLFLAHRQLGWVAGCGAGGCYERG